MATFCLFPLLLLVGLTSATDMVLTLPHVTNWGIFGPLDSCPEGHRYAHGFQLKTQSNQGPNADDTALNGIRLFCGNPKSHKTPTVTSSVGQFGDWGEKFSCYPGVLTGYQLRVEKSVGAGDDTATNNVRFMCSSSTDNMPDKVIEGDGQIWGDWGESRHCNKDQSVCGIKTQVEPIEGDRNDNTALNNVELLCCDYDDDNKKRSSEHQ